VTQHDHSSTGTTAPAGSGRDARTTTSQKPRSLQAASATPAAEIGTPEIPGEELSVVVTGLDHPRGFTWGPDGALYVALAGDGLTERADGNPAPPPRPDAPPSVVRVENGEVTPIVHGLPSTQDPYGDVMGPVDVGFLGDTLYILQDAAAEEVDDVGIAFPNGLYAIERTDDTRLVSSVTVFVEVNPADNKYHFVPLGEPFAMVPDERGEGFWVVDANQGVVLHVLPEGTITKIADISLDHPVPTAIAPTPDGGVFVGFLGNGVHADGTSKIIKVLPNGDVYDFWTGLTAVTGIVMAPDGTLYALELSTGNDEGIRPHTGRVVRQTGPDSLEEVVTGLNYPISMKMGPDGALYISLPAITTDGEKGSIIRADPVLGEPIAVPTGYPNGTASAGEGDVVR
jgi:hypothetical protein